MTEQHPITPPPELVEQWLESTRSYDSIGAYPPDCEQRICTAAARWGADQELEACCEWLRESLATPSLVECFLANRRPKRPSLKEQALAMLELFGHFLPEDKRKEADTIRRALEALPDD